MTGVKLYASHPCTSDYYDYYTPRDYYGYASQIAKKFCKAHPGVDKETVYMAASEAAEVYDLGGLKTDAKFETVVQVKIRAALLAQKRKESERMAVTAEEKAAMIADRAAGMSYPDIAKKYGRNASSVSNNLLNWKRAGLFPPEEPGSEEPAEEPEAVAENATTTEPDEPHPEAYPGQIHDDPPEQQAAEPLNAYVPISDSPALTLTVPNVWEALAVELSQALCGLLGAGTITVGRSYSADKAQAKVTVRTADGKQYKLKLEEV